ncbi:MRPS21 [Cordylochernes scorpioides]|uniref:MRPS21 n=1 Tax=Cordylochernes scorpioides TaxID=51811 RepID=A0ABY6LKK3_9ARAC|nr:MRPS21 [Cordylochernes scorpioides]
MINDTWAQLTPADSTQYCLEHRILATEGVFDNYRNTRYYEKPYQRRNRVSFTIAKTIYNEDMTNRINFLSRKNREDPWTGY